MRRLQLWAPPWALQPRLPCCVYASVWPDFWPTCSRTHLEFVAILVLQDEPQVVLALMLRHLSPGVAPRLTLLGVCLACGRGTGAQHRRRVRNTRGRAVCSGSICCDRPLPRQAAVKRTRHLPYRLAAGGSGGRRQRRQAAAIAGGLRHPVPQPTHPCCSAAPIQTRRSGSGGPAGGRARPAVPAPAWTPPPAPPAWLQMLELVCTGRRDPTRPLRGKKLKRSKW